MSKRLPWIRLLLLVLVLTCAGGAAAFLCVSRADLQPFLQRELSKALGRPLAVGEVRLRFFPTPALDFKDIAIESPGEVIAAAHIPHLHVQPEFLPLLQGKLLFNKITLQSPLLKIDLAHLGNGDAAAGPERKNISGPIKLKTLRLRQGNLTLIHSTDSRFPSPLLIPNVNGRLVMKADHPLILMVDGELSMDGVPAPFSGDFSWAGGDAWRRETLSGKLQLTRLPLPFLVRRIPGWAAVQAAGNLDIALRVQGTPAAGAVIDLAVTGDNAAVSAPGLAPNPLPVKKATLHAIWHSDRERELFSHLALDLGGPQVTGMAALEKRPEGLWLKTELASPPLTTADLPLAAAQSAPLQGKVAVKSCVYDGPVAAMARFPQDLAPLRAELRLTEIATKTPATTKLEKGEGTLFWEGNRLHLDNGRFVLGNSAGELSVIVDDLFNKSIPTKLQATGSLPLGALAVAIPEKNRNGLPVEGLLPFRAQGSEMEGAFRIDLEADLASLVKNLSGRGVLAADTPAALALSLDLNRETWRLQKGSLTCGPVALKASGDGRFQNLRDFRLRLDSDALLLAKIGAAFPQLHRWKLRGQAALNATLSGTREGPPRIDGELRLAGAGMRTTPMLADLNDINGRFLFSPEGIKADQVTGLLGTSPLRIVTTALSDFSNPVLTLHVQGPQIRAEELIFPSDQAYLYDVDGRLRIDAKELRFEKVDVTLGQGTKATVRGHVRNFKEPETWLHITSREAIIDEVIALWQRSVPKPKEPPRRKEVKLLIDMAVAKGSLDGFHFTQAVGQLRLKEGKIVIHPVDFRAGPGFGQGQIIVDPRPAGPAQLRISGHVENLDAATISRQVLEAESIATGSLSGDFYLECRAEKGFLTSSQGKFSAAIGNGVLKEFKTLAKVFSLLNVSQLFSMKLPDMSREGMPFDRITATGDLNQGILASENLLVDSTSMKLSLVGNLDLKNDRIDAVMGVRPLGTVDTVMSRIPIAGWVLGGEEKALITAHFRLTGQRADPQVEAIPVSSLSDKAVGVFRRILQLPGRIITNPRELMGGPGKTAP